MRSKFYQVWLLWLCLALLGLINSSTLQLCDSSELTPNIFTCGNSEVDLSQKEFLTLTCIKTCHSDYFKFIGNINNNGRMKNITTVKIKKCPIPHESYIDIFNIFNTTSVEKFYLENIPNSSVPNFEPLHFVNLTSVEHLEIINASIEELPEALFEEMINLKNLSLDSNGLQILPRNIFKPLKKLTSLNLDNNALRSLDKNIFQSLINLEKLTLNGNKLDHLPNDVFSSLINLKDLSMNRNNMTTLKSGTFDSLRNLMYLSLTENYLSQVPPEPFVNNSNLIQINMCEAFHKQNFTLPPRFFANLKSLQSLYLERNKLSFLPKELFQKTTNLEELYLDGNKLSSLNDAVENLANLKILNIAHNELKTVTARTFEYLVNLKELNLSNNNLTEVFHDGNPISGKKIDLSNNFLSSMRWCSPVFRVVNELDLSFNRFKILQTEDFLAFHQSVDIEINLSNNIIERIDLDLTRLPAVYNPNNVKLTFKIDKNPINCSCEALNLTQYIQYSPKPNIIISANDIFCEDPETLKKELLQNMDLKKLKCKIKGNCPNSAEKNCSCNYRSYDNTVEINCTSIGMSEFPKELPIYEYNENYALNTKQNYELFFTDNKITSMGGLNNLSKHFNITGLYLSFNELENIEDLPNLEALQILKLDNNYLKYLGSQTIERINSFSNLTSIALHKNPWICNCNTKYLLHFIKDQKKKIEDYKNITCKESGQPIDDLIEKELCEISLVVILTCTSVAIIGLLTGAVITIYYKYQREIKVWMFAHPWFRWIVTEEEIDKDKLFDAFISFSHKDEDFVHEILIPKLERNEDFNYKVCVHDRNFTPGGFIPTEIVNCIENSRRTIIVLTSNFLHSYWCCFEFKTAYFQALEERCARVIIIMLEDVSNHEKLDPDLKAYIKMHTYVQWGDPMFWKKLKYALPHPQHYTKRCTLNVDLLNGAYIREQ